MAGMTGTCTGNLLVTKGAGASGGGICSWTDAERDMWYGSVRRLTAERAALGTWVVSCGTGKFASATGGSNFTTLTNPETGGSKLDVLGSVILQKERRACIHASRHLKRPT